MGEKRIFTFTDNGVKNSNNYFYLTGNLDFFPQDSHGGSNQMFAGNELIFHIVGREEPIYSDIDSTKPFIRKRHWLRDFIHRHNLSGGDDIVIERVSDREYLIYPSAISFNALQDIFGSLIYETEIGPEKDIRIYKEGVRRLVEIYRYERDSQARNACIDYYQCKCFICEFDFQEEFGEIGKDYIHVHHEIPISERGEEYEIDPINDLKPVCPNCHAMLHRKKPPYTVDQLKRIRKNAIQKSLKKHT